MILWPLVALGLAVLPVGVILALGTRPAVFPYTMYLWHKGIGIVGPFWKKRSFKKNAIGKDPDEVPNSVFKEAANLPLADAKRIRDALMELGTVPTVAKGLKELGYKNMVECFAKKDFYKRPSPYTHPLQQPYTYIPGVPAKTFYDPSEFEWAKILEDNYDVIRAELDNVLADGGRGFKFYRTEFATNEKYWNTFDMFIQGDKIEENCALVPKTTEILESLPRLDKDHIMFSAFNPRSHTPRHTGPFNGVLRGHLAMIIPPGCRMKVGDDVREWEEGKVMVFDDSFWHEVWNDSDQVRIVLFMNFWHPAIPAEDVVAIDKYISTWNKLHPMVRAHRKLKDEPRPNTFPSTIVPPAKAS